MGTHGRQGERRRVLIVDDEPLIAEILEEIVEGEGHATVVAENGRAALDRIATEDFDVVLSDLIMPELDGPGLWRALQAIRPALSQRVIFITGDTLSEPAQRFLAESCCPVIEKPFIPDEVRAALRAVLAG